MSKRLLLFLITMAASLAGFAQTKGGKPGSPSENKLSARFVGADGEVRDVATGLPKRIVHKASGIVLVLIPAGEFLMGTPDDQLGQNKEERRHRRVIRKPFYLGETEVTVGQFRKFAEATGYKTDAERGTPFNDHTGPGSFAATPDGDRTWTASASWRNPFPILKDFLVQEDHPVVQVSWNDAQRFCEHFNLRLPTEAQWEYAARAGSRDRFPWGDSEAAGRVYANVADETARKRFPSFNVIFSFDDGVELLAPVGRSKPNAWMLRDMMGNVEEWCLDPYGKYPEDGADESAASGDGSTGRILRGGSWLSNPGITRLAARFVMAQSSRRDFQGFRVAAAIEDVR